MDRNFYKKLTKLALPISIQGVVSSTLGLIDTLMVGTLGEKELAAVGIAMQIFFIHYLILYGFTSGSATFMAQFYGAKDHKNIKKVLGFAISVSALVGLIFAIIGLGFTEEFLRIYSKDAELIKMATPYVRLGSITFFTIAISAPMESAFRSIQRTKVPLIVSTVVFSTNTFLNYVLIFGKFGMPKMGLIGACMATVIARLFEAILNIFFAAQNRCILRGGFRDYFGWNSQLAKRIIKNNIPTTTNELFWSLGQTMYVAAFSRIGTTAYAAYQVAASINSIFHFAAFSIGDAALILVGEQLGQGRSQEAYSLSKKLIRIGIIIGTFFGILLMICGSPMLGLFSLSQQGKYYAIRIIFVFAITLPLSLYNGMQITGFLRAGGDTTFAMFTEMGCVWLVAVPAAFVASLYIGMPIYLAVLAIKLEDAVKFVIVTKRYLSRKWINVMIEGL